MKEDDLEDLQRDYWTRPKQVRRGVTGDDGDLIKARYSHKGYWTQNVCCHFLYIFCLKHFSFQDELSELIPKNVQRSSRS